MSQVSSLLKAGGAGGLVNGLTGNSGGEVGPDGTGNINVIGTGDVTVVGNPGTHTLTITLSGADADSFVTDAGTATPALGVLHVTGGNNIHTAGATNVVTVNVAGTTDHSLQLGNASGSLTSLGVAANGALPIGSVGADPVLATITPGTNISVTNGAGSITIGAVQAPVANNYTNVNSTPYVVASTDYYLSVDTSALAITIQLPNAPTTSRIFVIKDRTGSAGTRNITVTTVGGAVLIDGATSQVFNTNYEAMNLIFNSVSYEIW